MTLSVRDLTVKAGGCPIIDGISFDLSPGECVGLIGPNGSGKSTLMRAIAGTREIDGGALHIGDSDLAGMARRARARRLAYLPQARRIEWAMPVRDVVALGRLPHRDRDADAARAAQRALSRVDLAALAGRPADVLSGGELARVLLARALATEAPYLVADEPLAALDARHQFDVMKAMKDEAARGAGVLVSLHDLTHAARFLDRVMVLDRGRLVADGAPGSVLDDALLARVYGIEAVRGERDGTPFIMPWAPAAGARLQPEGGIDEKTLCEAGGTSDNGADAAGDDQPR